MHPSSLAQMSRMVGTYLNKAAPLEILDVGSFDVNGTYKLLFVNPTWTYVGSDMSPGKNVDIVLKPEHGWGTMGYVVGRFDVVITGQTMEHVRNPFKFALDLAAACKSGGLCFAIAPWQWEVHRCPIDCWRILPDGMKYVMEEAGFETVECGIHETDTVYVGRRR